MCLQIYYSGIACLLIRYSLCVGPPKGAVDQVQMLAWLLSGFPYSLQVIVTHAVILFLRGKNEAAHGGRDISLCMPRHHLTPAHDMQGTTFLQQGAL